MKRFASTRSEEPPSQPNSGRAQWSVGSIEGEGIRYGLTTQALTASTTATATAVVATHDERRHQRVAQRRRIASAALARFVEPLLALPRVVKRPEDAVVLVREAHCRTARPGLRAAADEDLQVRTLQAGRALQAVALAGEVDDVFAEQVVHDLELLGEARHALACRRELEPVGLVLAFHPAGAHAERDAAAGDLSRRRCVPRQQRWVAERHG